jgi:L-ascorbate metabolism protein UlaG (beta-lactamase superfamily)
MRLTWLGWAGVELEVDGSTVVIDALADPGAVFAALGERAADAPQPEVVAPSPGRAVAALVTHLHRDHADAAAVSAALQPGAPVLEPPGAGGETAENLALLQADHELAAAGVERRNVTPWETVAAGPFEITALPAVDGTGDPQVSWLVTAGGVRVLHLGDTLFHGYWWRIAQRYGPFDAVLAPVNGAVVSFPHRQPASPFAVAMTPEQAAVAAAILAPRAAIAIHGDGYALDGVYEPARDPGARFAALAAERGVRVERPPLGRAWEVAPTAR